MIVAQLKDIVPGIEYSLHDKTTNSNLRIETLTLLRTLLASHPVTAFHPHLKALIPPVVKAVNDSYYKIAAEALRVVVRPRHSSSCSSSSVSSSNMGSVLGNCR